MGALSTLFISYRRCTCGQVSTCRKTYLASMERVWASVEVQRTHPHLHRNKRVWGCHDLSFCLQESVQVVESPNLLCTSGRDGLGKARLTQTSSGDEANRYAYFACHALVTNDDTGGQGQISSLGGA